MPGEGNTYLHPSLQVDAADATYNQAFLVRSSPLFPGIHSSADNHPTKASKQELFFFFFPHGKGVSGRRHGALLLGIRTESLWALRVAAALSGPDPPRDSPHPAHGHPQGSTGCLGLGLPLCPRLPRSWLGQWNRLWTWHGHLTEPLTQKIFSLIKLWLQHASFIRYTLQTDCTINPNTSFVKPLSFTPCK